MKRSEHHRLPYLPTAELPALVERAAREGWTELALTAHPFIGFIRQNRGWYTDNQPPPLELLSRIHSLRRLELVGFNRPGAQWGALAKLPALEDLALVRCAADDAAADAIAELDSLTSLWAIGGSIGDAGAAAIARLPALTSLNLNSNKIGDAGAAALSRLTHLTYLNLNSNRIGDDGARALCTLLALEHLHLAFNRIDAGGLTAILDTWAAEPCQHRSTLRLLGNPGATSGLLPAELFATSRAQSIIAAWRRYKASATRPPLNEAKLLVVGNEAVGKTSLIRFLTTDTPRDPDEQKTPGACIHERIETAEWHPDGDVTLNVWDFGGQEIMHGTHRFFLTRRSLYLLLLEARREDSGRTIYDWLDTIANRADDSPVIVVINKCDRGDDNLGLDETAIRRDHPQVVGFVRTACNDDDRSRASVAALRAKIVEVIQSDPRLKHVRDPMPPAWLRIKDALAEEAKAKKVIETRAFERLCEVAEGEDAVTSPAEQRVVMGLLHDLGVVVAHGWSRDGATRMADITLLDPNWLTGAIYALLNSPTVRAQGGEFGWAQLPALLADPTLYPQARHGYIIDMMKDDDIAVAFELPPAGSGDRRFLIPEALPASEPDYDDLWPADSLRFRYEYGFLPPDLLPRFIVQAHRNLTRKRTCWRTGAVLAVQGCKVLVRANRGTRKVEIQVSGPGPRRRGALAVIRDDLETVHRLNLKDPPTAQVPLPDKPACAVPYQHLQTLEERHGPEYSFDPVGGDRTYTVRELLASVGPSPRAPRDRPPSPARTPPAPATTDRPWVWNALSAGVGLLALGGAAYVAAQPDLDSKLTVGIPIAVGLVAVVVMLLLNPRHIYRRLLALWLAGAGGVFVVGKLQASFDIADGKGQALWDGTLDWPGWLAVVAVAALLAFADHRQDGR